MSDLLSTWLAGLGDTDASPRELAELLWLGATFGAELRGPSPAVPMERTRSERPEGEAVERSAAREDADARKVQVEVADEDEDGAEARGDATVRTGTVGRPVRRSEGRLLFRAFHRLGVIEARGRRELDVARTVRASAQADEVVLAWRAGPSRGTDLLVLEDAAGQMEVWRPRVKALVTAARASGRFGRVVHQPVDLTAHGVATPLRLPTRETVVMPVIGEPGRTLLVLVVSDGLGRGVPTGGVLQLLARCGVDASVAWVHPWGAGWWADTWAGHLPTVPAGRYRRARPEDAVGVPLVPLSSAGLDALQGWAQGRSSRGLYAKAWRRGPPTGSPSPSLVVDVEARAEVFARTADPASRALLGLAAAVPGKVDVDLLTALGGAFDVPFEEVHVAQALASGLLERVGTEEPLVVRFRSLAARKAALRWTQRSDLPRVMRYLLGLLRRGEAGSRLGIDVDVLLYALGEGEERAFDAEGAEALAAIVEVGELGEWGRPTVPLPPKPEPVESPFHPSRPYSGEELPGRMGLVREIVAGVNEGKSTLLVSPYPNGKTSLLKAVQRQLERQGRAFVWVSGRSVVPHDSLFEVVLHDASSVLLLDDVQAVPTRWVERLRAEMERRGLVVVGTSTIEEPELPWAPIALGPLADEDIQRWVGPYLGDAAQRVVEWSSGQPILATIVADSLWAARAEGLEFMLRAALIEEVAGRVEGLFQHCWKHVWIAPDQRATLVEWALSERGVAVHGPGRSPWVAAEGWARGDRLNPVLRHWLEVAVLRPTAAGALPTDLLDGSPRSLVHELMRGARELAARFGWERPWIPGERVGRWVLLGRPRRVGAAERWRARADDGHRVEVFVEPMDDAPWVREWWDALFHRFGATWDAPEWMLVPASFGMYRERRYFVLDRSGLTSVRDLARAWPSEVAGAETEEWPQFLWRATGLAEWLGQSRVPRDVSLTPDTTSFDEAHRVHVLAPEVATVLGLDAPQDAEPHFPRGLDLLLLLVLGGTLPDVTGTGWPPGVERLVRSLLSSRIDTATIADAWGELRDDALLAGFVAFVGDRPWSLCMRHAALEHLAPRTAELRGPRIARRWGFVRILQEADVVDEFVAAVEYWAPEARGVASGFYPHSAGRLLTNTAVVAEILQQSLPGSRLSAFLKADARTRLLASIKAPEPGADAFSLAVAQALLRGERGAHAVFDWLEATRPANRGTLRDLRVGWDLRGSKFPPMLPLGEPDVVLLPAPGEPALVEVARALRARGLHAWVHAPDSGLETTRRVLAGRAAAVLVGGGRFSSSAFQSILSQSSFAARVIPVLLPGADQVPDALASFQAVRFAHSLDEPAALDQLEWAITGRRPLRR